MEKFISGGGSKEREGRVPPQSIFLAFKQFSAKILLNNRLALPLGRPLGNPGSATDRQCHARHYSHS